MDTQALHVALQQSFSADASLRDPAEKAIKDLKYVKGAPCMLLQVAAEKQVSDTILEHTSMLFIYNCTQRDSYTECVIFSKNLHRFNIIFAYK